MLYVHGKQNTGFRNSYPNSPRIRQLVLALAAALGTTAALSAQVNPSDLERLQKEASLHGSVRVLVVFNDSIALGSLKNTLPELRVAFEQSANVLMNELGAEAISTGRWNNGIGQAGFYVTAAGLRLLEASSNARSFQTDLTSKLRFRVQDLDGSVDAVEASLDLGCQRFCRRGSRAECRAKRLRHRQGWQDHLQAIGGGQC